LETGEEESRNGFLNFNPQKSMDKSTLLTTILPPYMQDSQVQCLGFRGSRFRVQGLMKVNKRKATLYGEL
jgi:hypothetical protein